MGCAAVVTGRGGDSFQPRWLVLALPALLRGVTAAPALELGFEIEGCIIVLHIDENGPRAVFQPDRQPGTILKAAPEIICRACSWRAHNRPGGLRGTPPGAMSKSSAELS